MHHDAGDPEAVARWVTAQLDAMAAGRDIVNTTINSTPPGAAPAQPAAWQDAERSRRVFVVYGRNRAARRAMFDFLRSIGLFPIEWSQARELTGKPTPYTGEILDAALSNAQAIVVLLTPDETVSLIAEHADGPDDPELKPAFQPRPNVLFEAGLALGRAPDRTVLVRLGTVRPFSDVAGRHQVDLRDTVASRQELASRLKSAGCPVDLSGTDWHDTGNFAAPVAPSAVAPVPPAGAPAVTESAAQANPATPAVAGSPVDRNPAGGGSGAGVPRPQAGGSGAGVPRPQADGSGAGVARPRAGGLGAGRPRSPVTGLAAGGSAGPAPSISSPAPRQVAGRREARAAILFSEAERFAKEAASYESALLLTEIARVYGRSSAAAASAVVGDAQKLLPAIPGDAKYLRLRIAVARVRWDPSALYELPTAQGSFISDEIGLEVEALIDAARELSGTSPDQALGLLAAAERRATPLYQARSWHDERVDLLLGKAALAMAAVDPEWAERMAQWLKTPDVRAVTLARISARPEVYANAPRVAERATAKAVEILTALTDAITHAIVVSWLAKGCRLRGQLSQASLYEDLAGAGAGLVSMAAWPAVTWRPADLLAVLDPDRGVRLAHQVPGQREREEALAEIAGNLTASPDRAERVARSIGDLQLRVMALAAVAEALLDAS